MSSSNVIARTEASPNKRISRMGAMWPGSIVTVVLYDGFVKRTDITALSLIEINVNYLIRSPALERSPLQTNEVSLA